MPGKRIPECERRRIIGDYECQRKERGIEWGECFCGCGEETNLAPRTSSDKDWLKGMPKRYINVGHKMRKPLDNWIEEDRGYETPCWIWQGIISRGYGLLFHREKQGCRGAHRYWYEKLKEPIPEGLTLDHLCRVPACVNPFHLEPVTTVENIRRGKVAKITFEEANEIRRLYATGNYLQRELAEMFGLSPTYITDIIHSKKWKT